MNAPHVPVVRIEGVDFCSLGLGETADYIVDQAALGVGGWVVTPNVDIMRRIKLDAGFRQLIDDVSLLTPDGMPIIWAARLQGEAGLHRVAGADLVIALCAAAAGRGVPVTFIGGNPGAAERAADVLRARYPGLVVAGVHVPPFGFEKDADAMAAIGAFVERHAPGIVFVGLGSPKQERLIAHFRAKAPQAWWLGIGVTFSFVAGEMPRAPRWMQRAGLEWVHRLSKEPRRLATRYLVHDIPFALWMLWRALRTRRRSAC